MRQALLIPVLTLLAILCGYEFFLRLAEPSVSFGQSFVQTNAMRIEDFVDNGKQVNTVLVGTSLTGVMPRSALPRDWENLGLFGDSVMTSLEIASARAPLPKTIMIEINLAEKLPAEDTVKAAVGGPERIRRRYLWFTRTGYHLGNLVFWIYHRNMKADPTRQVAFNQFLKLNGQVYSVPPGPTLVENLRTMKSIVTNLRKKGVTVKFYMMPVDRHLNVTPRSTMLRQQVNRVFDKGQYCWLDLDRGENWQTADGLHLLAGDAIKVAKRFPSAPCLKTDVQAHH